MRTVLSQLNAVPGVIGSLVCEGDGRVAAEVFPPIFGDEVLSTIAGALGDGAEGLDFAAGGIEAIDFRFGESRLLVKPWPGSLLVVLCGKTTNPQYLSLALSVAASKLQKLREASARAALSGVESPEVDVRPPERAPPTAWSGVREVPPLPGPLVAAPPPPPPAAVLPPGQEGSLSATTAAPAALSDASAPSLAPIDPSSMFASVAPARGLAALKKKLSWLRPRAGPRQPDPAFAIEAVTIDSYDDKDDGCCG